MTLIPSSISHVLWFVVLLVNMYSTTEQGSEVYERKIKPELQKVVATALLSWPKEGNILLLHLLNCYCIC